jgi:hypothetical protein
VFKTFTFGIVLGAAAAAALVWFVPTVDQHREPSLISVEANGGNRETFHINLPQDRIMVGTAGADGTVPAGLLWPARGALATAATELFKIRDGRDVVVGVASRMSGSGEATGAVVEWTLHLPARGTLYATMQPAAAAGGDRRGTLRAGTLEFDGLHGEVRERFVSGGEQSPAEGDVDGRIELETALVGLAGDAT